MNKLRIGVDVGGTFTDVVAIDAACGALVARIKVPTTHAAPEGVAAGIIAGIEQMLARSGVAPADVAFIAHSTTQATNALLEGDVARVGVVGLVPFGGWLARAQMRFRPVAFSPGVSFAPRIAFTPSRDAPALDRLLEAFAREGIEAVAVSEPFGVDRPAREREAVRAARAHGMLATSGHDVTAVYGLRARTRTTALNAAILPKMVRTAEMTRAAVERASIAAPLMIMRSDGGVMDVREVMRRPILTMLSGPAAGVAGALLYENVTDGIFLEVGGTSTDCCVIRGGRPQIRSARIGGHRTMLHTIDSRTLGIAGGSMVRLDARGIADVGPRSAHIAGARYAVFCDEADFVDAQLQRFAPSTRDPADYLRFVLSDGSYATLTPTCASNVLGFVPERAFARGNAGAARAAFALLAREFGGDADSQARRLLELAGEKVHACIETLIAEYELSREQLELVGGGGGATALVPFVAERYGLQHRIARDAEVISPIGVALALVRDVVERTIVNPSPEDIVRIRREAADRVIAAGAAPDRVEVSVEIDAQRNRVRATASGATAMVEAAAAPGALHVERNGEQVRIVDERGVVRLALRGARTAQTTVGDLDRALEAAMESATSFGDVGRALPELYILHRGRIADLRGLVSIEQARALVREEVAGRDPSDTVTIITVKRLA
ncbi:MAG TPA: hydantoinase/oxoprolinase family protein [Verrucomicrobiae bacterium]|nr:hydantoinase/oxoprolinase family protein [Verrucomicrobiae bacterium]